VNFIENISVTVVHDNDFTAHGEFACFIAGPQVVLAFGP
jgi:hypothetical protein